MARQATMDAFLAAKPARVSIARSASTVSTLSCITLNNDMPSSTDIASTPPTSIDGGDTSNLNAKIETVPTTILDVTTTTIPTTTTNSTALTAEAAPAGGRSRRVRASVASYNENALLKANTTRRRAESPRQRDLSGQTLAAAPSPSKDARDKLVRDGIQALDLDWRVDVLPGEKMELDDSANKTDAKNGSRSRNLLRKAGAVVDKTKSVLGKRTRDLLDASKSGAKDLGRRASLRARDILDERRTATPSEEPEAKKRRVDSAAAAAAATTAKGGRKAVPSGEAPKLEVPLEIKRKPVPGPRKKRWLSQGMYVGQEAGFDPRLKPGDIQKRTQKTQTEQESSSSAPTAVPVAEAEQTSTTRRQPILPLPMFAGKRLLETGRDFKLPFTIFHPLEKSYVWRKKTRNVFRGDAADYWRHSKPSDEESLCICGWKDGCGDNCFNRLMFYECDDSNCGIGSSCTNRMWADLKRRVNNGSAYDIGVEVIKTEGKGYGIRSSRSFNPGQIILEYTGDIITQEECERRMRTWYKDAECFYLMTFDQNMIIDATRGSTARFVNHSCEPNCRMVKWTVQGKPRMALFAGDAGIETGEELTYDYNFDPYSAKNMVECRCGTPSCRGVLGPRPGKERAASGDHPSTKDSNTATAATSASSAAAASSTKRKLKDVVEEVRSKKRRLSADMTALLLKQKEKKEAEEKGNRAARAAMRADIKSAKSKRVVAAKLTKKNKAAKVTVKVAASPVKRGARAATMRRSVDTVRSNVVRTIKGATAARPANGKKTITVVRDVFEIPDVPSLPAEVVE